MDYKKYEEFTRLHTSPDAPGNDTLHTQAEEIYESAKEIEELTKDTMIGYGAVRARAAFEQGGLRRALDEWARR